MLKRFSIVICIGIFFLLQSMVAMAEDNFASRPEVQQFIHTMAKKYGFKSADLTRLFNTIKIRPRIIQSVRMPLEAQPWYLYQMVFITPSRIQGGVEFWNHNKAALERAEKMYGVPASIIVATIGVETKYGKEKGAYSVLEALANIAFSASPRAPFFRQELEEFLLLTREQHLNPMTIKGSYAGAIGQPQFMPSSYRHFAVNFSGHKNIDLSNNEYDIIGSIANYYQKHGWQPNQPVAIPTIAQHSRYRFMLKEKPMQFMSQDDLEEYGLFPISKLPPHQKMNIIELQGAHGSEYWIGFNNFEVIKRYNPSNLYAMAVYQLSYYINSLREKKTHA